LLGVGGAIFDRMNDRDVVCVFFILNAGGSVCGCMCVYTHTHTRTAIIEYSVVSPGVGTRHLKGPKNPAGPKFGICVFVFVHKVHMCMYVLGGGMRSWTNYFILEHIFSFETKKQKM